MGRLRRAVALAGLTCCILAGMTFQTDRAQAYPELLRVMDWNAAGNVEGYGRDNPNWLAQELQPYIENSHPYPTVITLQEVCRDQAVNLFTALPPDWGTTSFAFWAARSAGSGATICGGQAFGNATFIFGGGSQSSYAFEVQDSDPNPPNPALYEIRGMACMNGAIGGVLAVNACSIHASAASDYVADQQIYEAQQDIFRAVASGLQYVAAGDFNLNLVYGQFPSVDAFYGNFDEADEYSPPIYQPTHSEGKIDYIFLSQNTAGYASDLTMSADYVSDHRILFSEIVINMPD